MFSTKPAFVALLVLSTLFRTSVNAYYGEKDGVRHHYNGSRYQTCEILLERREWRTLSYVEKSDYIDAVKCLQAHPALDPPIPEAQTRFDEFQSYHIHIAGNVHHTGQFLPWHRLFVRTYENALRNECGYQGATPYWDWTQDYSSFAQSPVFDPVTGFGGDGVPETYTLPPTFGPDSQIDPAVFRGCVTDGPFANYTLRLGPGKLVTEHCLVRGFQNFVTGHLSPAALANATKQTNYENFRIELEGQPITPDFRMHDGGHVAVGGEMSNVLSSPGDPLFYLHHANLDRIWWNWQKMTPSRLFEMTGRSTIVPPFHNVTLEYPLLMGSLGETLPISDVMNIQSEPTCYTYI